MILNKFIEETQGMLLHPGEISGVIQYTQDILCTYFTDDFVIKSLQIFATSRVEDQINHTTKLLETIQKVIMLFCSVEKEDVNTVLTNLGFFNGKFALGRQTSLYDYLIKVEVESGLILLTVAELS